jgi:hypothetical protein
MLNSSFAVIVLRDCEAWQICIAGDSGQLSPVGRGNASEKLWISSKARASSSCARKNATEPVSRSSKRNAVSGGRSGRPVSSTSTSPRARPKYGTT